MNTNTTFARSILGRSLAVAVLGLAALAATPARADDVPTKVVQVSDLNRSSETGRRAIAHRIERAANTVCGDVHGADRQNTAVHACRERAVMDAIAQLHDPAFDAWYAARSGQPAAARVASVK
jgi:UrcA family protein